MIRDDQSHKKILSIINNAIETKAQYLRGSEKIITRGGHRRLFYGVIEKSSILLKIKSDQEVDAF